MRRRLITSPTQRPPFSTPSSHRFERGLSPWHVDAFPEHLQSQAPEHGVRQSGWFECDYWGTAIGYIPDGMVFEVNTMPTWREIKQTIENQYNVHDDTNIDEIHIEQGKPIVVVIDEGGTATEAPPSRGS